MSTCRQAILLVMALLLASGGSCQIQRDPGSPIGRRITAPPTDKMWQAPSLMGSSLNVLQYPRVAVSSHGDAVVVWAEVPPNLNAMIRANTFTRRPSAGLRVEPPCCWGTATTIGDSDTNDVIPDVAMDDHGHALAVWHNKNNIYVNRHPQGTGGWDRNPESIKINRDFTHPMNPPRLAMNRSGLAIAAWQEKALTFISGRNIGLSTIFAKMSSYPWVFPSGQGTQLSAPPTVTPIGMPPEYQVRRPPQVALDPQGNALAVWEDGSSIAYNYQAVPGGGRPIISGTFPDEDPQVALDGQGNGLAVWINSGRIFAGRFTPGSGGQWQGQPQEISAPQAGASTPRITIQQAPDRPGQGVAVWAQGGRIFARRFDPAAGGWEDQPRALSTAGGAARNPAIAMDYLGHAQAAWIQQAGGEDGVFATQFTPGYGWGAPVSLKTESGNTSWVDVALYPRGVAVAAWKQLRSQNEHAIYARFYAPPIR